MAAVDCSFIYLHRKREDPVFVILEEKKKKKKALSVNHMLLSAAIEAGSGLAA